MQQPQRILFESYSSRYVASSVYYEEAANFKSIENACTNKHNLSVYSHTWAMQAQHVLNNIYTVIPKRAKQCENTKINKVDCSNITESAAASDCYLFNIYLIQTKLQSWLSVKYTIEF